MKKEHNKTEEMIEELARSVAAGFLGVDKQMKELRSDMDTGFSDVYAKMDAGFSDVYAKMDAGFSDVYAKMDAGFSAVNAKMDAGFSATHAELAVMKEEISEIKKRLIEVKHFAKSNDDAILDVVFDLQKRVKVLERKITAIAK